jgi:DNA-binding CsgD family transcriptional regulator
MIGSGSEERERGERSVKSRGSPAIGRLAVLPNALAAGPWDLPAATLCCVLLAGILVLEILTPHAVVSAIGLVPLLGAMWLLSNRMAALVAATALVVFAASVGLEPNNRLTIVLIGVATSVAAGLTRLQATALAGSLSTGPRIAALTAREREVARLAGQAYTAAEIGARLHIGERTVETHLANTYMKLRISSRRELIRMASRLEPGNERAAGGGSRPLKTD